MAFSSEILDSSIRHYTDLIGDQILYVAYSGGVDSSVLLQRLVALYGNRVKAIHIEDDRQQRLFCLKQCTLLKIQCIVVDGRNITRPNDVRRLKHQIFARYGGLIFMGHHQDDVVENCLFRFIAKGSVMPAISPVVQYDNFTIIRPMIRIKKDDLINIASTCRYAYYESLYNSGNHCNRNIMRNDILPRLKSIHHNAAKNLYSVSCYYQQQHNFIKDIVKRFYGDRIIYAEISEFSCNSRCVLIRYWLSMRCNYFSPHKVILHIVNNLAKKSTWRYRLTAKYSVMKKSGYLYVMGL